MLDNNPDAVINPYDNKWSLKEVDGLDLLLIKQATIHEPPKLVKQKQSKVETSVKPCPSGTKSAKKSAAKKKIPPPMNEESDDENSVDDDDKNENDDSDNTPKSNSDKSSDMQDVTKTITVKVNKLFKSEATN